MRKPNIFQQARENSGKHAQAEQMGFKVSHAAQVPAAGSRGPQRNVFAGLA
jgi:hypothetical protein